ncbi:MAG: hypothetical protein NUW01_14370, partial [Gemmatimonadaceae bacterium]|nr:hypothetical protein [Gemmatimonadaceae bacterium]
MTIRAGGKSATQSDWRMFPEGEFLFTISDAKTKTVETQYGEKERITYTLTIHEADRGHLDEEAGEPLPGLAQSDRVFASFTIPDNLVFMKSGAPQESKLGAFLIDVLGRSTEQAKELKNHLLDGGYVDLEGIVGLPVRADIVHNET